MHIEPSISESVNEGISFLRNCGAAYVGSGNEDLVLSTELIR